MTHLVGGLLDFIVISLFAHTLYTQTAIIHYFCSTFQPNLKMPQMINIFHLYCIQANAVDFFYSVNFGLTQSSA